MLEEVNPRSYVIIPQDGLVRRNRTHLRVAKTSAPDDQQALGQHTMQIGEVPDARTQLEAARPVCTSVEEGICCGFTSQVLLSSANVSLWSKRDWTCDRDLSSWCDFQIKCI